jgi:predicted ribosome quality control (RQC) complex YloA/Tae2 family protein
LKKYKAKLPKLYHALDEALDCEKWREMGDYLYTYPQQVTKRRKKKRRFERFDGEGMITIPLDPKLDVKANAKKPVSKVSKRSQRSATHSTSDQSVPRGNYLFRSPSTAA